MTKIGQKHLGATVLLVAFIALISGIARAEDGSLVSFELEDHARIKYSNETWRGKAVILFLSNREGTKFNKDHVWTNPIVAEPFDTDVLVASIADVRGVPRLARGFVRGMFEPSQEDPVGLTLLDWEGFLFESYGLNDDAYHLLAFDNSHRLVYKASLKDFEPDELAKIIADLHEAFISN